MLPYGRQSINEADIEAVRSALQSDWLTTGPLVDQFELALAETADAKHAISVTSGTAALHVAYRAVGAGQGTEVVTTPLTFVATAAAAAVNGAKVLFGDVDYDTGLLDLGSARALMSSRTRVIAAVDYAGLPIDAQSFKALAHQHGAVLLEDAAHSVGSKLHGHSVGEIADVTTFSFFPTKNMTSAEGGAVITSDDAIALASRRFKGQGLVRDRSMLRYPDEGPWHQEVHEFGLNYRLPDVLCALGLSQLQRLESFKQRRKDIHARYSDAFAEQEGLRVPVIPEGADPAWHLYPLRVPAERRRLIFERMRELGVGVQVNYLPAYWHPVFEDLGYQRGMCPNAERYYSEEISLPLFPGLSDSEVDMVIETVLKVIHK